MDPFKATPAPFRVPKKGAIILTTTHMDIGAQMVFHRADTAQRAYSAYRALIRDTSRAYGAKRV